MKPALWVPFLEALSQARGGCDRCHLFMAPGDQAPPEVHGLPRTDVHSVFDLPDVLRDDPPTVWHDFGDANAAHLVHLRARLGGRFPITCLVQPWHLLSDEMLAGAATLGRGDVLVCPGQPLEGALHALWQPLDRPAEEREGRPEIVAIPPGVCPSPVSASEKADARYLLGLPAEQLIVLAFGELSPSAGMDVIPLLRVFEAAANRHAHVLYVLAGADPEGLAGRISDIAIGVGLQGRLVIRPNISRAAATMLFATADIFLSAADSVYGDNLLDVLEAMARGLPVIAAGLAGRHGCIDHGRTGFRVGGCHSPWAWQAFSGQSALLQPRAKSLLMAQGSSLDLRGLAECLDALVQNAALRSRLGAAALSYVGENHSWPSVVRRYADVWEQLVESGGIPEPVRPIVSPDSLADRLETAASLVTDPISRRTLVQITPDGEALLQNRRPVIYEAMQEVILAPVAIEVLSRAARPVSLGDLARSIADLGRPEANVTAQAGVAYHVMWCVKQGLLQPVGRRASTSAENPRDAR